MAQVSRMVALGGSVVVWLVLMLIALPLIEGGGSSSLLQLGMTSGFMVWLVWAAVAISYDRRAGRAA